jgi:nucleolar protein 14
LERERGENIRHELDQEFDTLRSLLFEPDPSATGSNAVPLGSKDPDSNPPNPPVSAQESPDTYDQNVRELAFDKRAKAKDRTKTEEELAIEEKNALEKAERQRQRRMLGQDEDESDEDLGKGRGKRKRERGADDLEDDYQSDRADWDGLGVGLEEESPAEDPESTETSESESGEEDGGEEENKANGSDIDEDGDEAESEPSVVEGGDHEDLVSTAGKPIPQTRSSKELPYTFPCPSSHEEFLGIVGEVADEDVPTVVQRIRALHHPSLEPTNKIKLQARSS